MWPGVVAAQVEAFVFLHVSTFVLRVSSCYLCGQRMAVLPTYSNHETTEGEQEASGY